MTSVTYIFRKKAPNYFSIESVFGTVIQSLEQKNYSPAMAHAPCDGASLPAIWRNLMYFSKLRADVFHITGDVHYAALVTGAHTILTVHDTGSALQGNSLKRLFVKMWWFWLPALMVKHITVISEFSKSEMIRLAPFARHKIRVIHNPFNSRWLPYPKEFNSDCPVILHLGCKNNKNLERTIQALHGIPCCLSVIGQLSEQQLLLLKEFGIHYTNAYHVPQEAMEDYYRQCDLVCFASTYEGFGLPIIEAQAVGRPVITSKLCSMPEVAGQGALFVDPFRVEDIRAAVLRLIGDDSLRERLVADGLENVKRFAPEHIAQQYISLYQEVAG